MHLCEHQSGGPSLANVVPDRSQSPLLVSQNLYGTLCPNPNEHPSSKSPMNLQ